MANSSDYRLGSIWIAKFDPSVGTEIRKTRPALVISGTLFNERRSKVTVLPFTSARPNLEARSLLSNFSFPHSSKQHCPSLIFLLP